MTVLFCQYIRMPYNSPMNAKNDLRRLMEQAEEEYGLKDDRPESVRVQSVLDIKSAIKLSLVEDLLKDLKSGSISSIHYLGFDGGPYFAEDTIELDIKRVFLNALVDEKILHANKSSCVWDDNIEGWIDVFESAIDPDKQDELQMIANQLRTEVKSSNLVTLVAGRFTYDTKSASLGFGNINILFKITENSHKFLDFMVNHRELNLMVDKDELYEIVFGRELPFFIKGEENHDRNKRVKDLNNVKTAINIRVKRSLNTVDELFSATGGGYIRNF